MAQPYLSLKRAKTLLVEIVNESPPGKRNALEDNVSGSSSCSYLNANGERCIVGEILHRLGMPTPKAGGFSVSGTPFVQKGYMSAETRSWLSRVQPIFDDGKFHTDPKTYRMYFVPVTWRQALAKVRERGLL